MEDELRFGIEEKVGELWRAIPGEPDETYSDAWLDADRAGLTADERFLWVLSWGPRAPAQNGRVWAQAKDTYRGGGKQLHEMSSKELEKLVACYPLSKGKRGWQARYLRNLYLHLRNRGLSMEKLEAALKEQDPFVARAVLLDVLEARAGKIVDCYLREVLLLDSFPIDRRVERVLAKYNIPPDPVAITAVCRKLNIPVRVLARATYDFPLK
jgi:hypothetical protein